MEKQKMCCKNCRYNISENARDFYDLDVIGTYYWCPFLIDDDSLNNFCSKFKEATYGR